MDNVEIISQCSFTLNYTHVTRCHLYATMECCSIFYPELLPLTLLFIAILVMNISFTSGAVNGFIYCLLNIIDLLYIDALHTLIEPPGSFLFISSFMDSSTWTSSVESHSHFVYGKEPLKKSG